jgi:DeoR family transcriptional regulator, aga operon transcriptional repressor
MRTPKDRPLLAEQRRRRILDLIENTGQVTVSELAGRFSISAVTVRADLGALSSKGVVVRSHGGAIRRLEADQDYPLRLKENVHHAEKARIGRAAAQLIRSNETIILDSGTTTAEIARYLKTSKLQSITVITNAMNVASELLDTPNVSVIMIGGMLRPISGSFVGPQAEDMLKELHADRFFLGVDGFDSEIGASTPDVFEARLNSLMMNISRDVTVVADSSKLGRRSVSRIGSLDRIHRLVTDNQAPADLVDSFRRLRIEVITA